MTLAECIVHPYRLNDAKATQAFFDLIAGGNNTLFIPIEQNISTKSAELRARYNLSLPDAFQVAVALTANCDAFLTNDATLKRVTEFNVLVLDEIQSEPLESS